MPSYKTSKYSTVKTQELTMLALGVLLDAGKPLTISEICAGDMGLVGQTTQKMARVLGDLVEGGQVMKTKSKSKGRMVYAATASLEAQGYDINKIVC